MNYRVRTKYGLERFESILSALEESRIVKIRNEDGMFVLREMCDEHFCVELTTEQLRALGEELIAMVEAR